jgi:hypothetical protein
MSETQLLTPFLEGGVQNSFYFNGRILTADALRADQSASRRQRQQLGKAIGSGVVCGLTVENLPGAAPPTLHVSAGLALNGLGQALELSQGIDVALARDDPENFTEAGLFGSCLPVDTGEYVTGRNVYVLALAPASGYREKAPMIDLTSNGHSNGNGQTSGCGFRFAVEGVQFRLVEIDLEDEDVLSGPALATLETLIEAEPQNDPVESRLRSLLAHLCLGTVDAADFPATLFSQLTQGTAAPDYGLLSRITDPDPANADEHTLTPCDVPLALIYWTTQGIQFVDMWSVRRRLTRPVPTEAALTLVSDRRLAEGEAAFLQFQAQIAYLTRPGIPQLVLDSIQARNYFRYLPPVGILPLTGIGLARGVDYGTFFQNLTVREPIYIEGAKLPALVRQSFAFPPVDISGDEVTMMWLYYIRENQQGVGGAMPQSYLVFSSGYLPFQGDARYDLNRYEYSNYGIIDRDTGFIF